MSKEKKSYFIKEEVQPRLNKFGKPHQRPNHYLSDEGIRVLSEKMSEDNKKYGWGGRNKVPLETWIERFKERHGDIYDYSKVKEIKSRRDKITVICPKHEVEFEITVIDHTKKGRCGICSGQNYSLLTRKSAIILFKETHGDRFDYSKLEWVDYSTPIIVICPEHGEFETHPRSHLRRKSGGCNKCGNKSGKIKKMRWTEDEFIQLLSERNNHLYDYSKLRGLNLSTNQKGIIICPEHGEFEQLLSSHLRGSSGCKECVRKKQSATARVRNHKPHNSLDIDLNELKKLKLSGYKNKELAEHFDCSIHTIERRLKKIREERL